MILMMSVGGNIIEETSLKQHLDLGERHTSGCGSSSKRSTHEDQDAAAVLVILHCRISGTLRENFG